MTWHQLFRQRFSNLATFLTRRVLRLPRGSLMARYAHLYLVFIQSALLHFLMDAASGYSLGRSGSPRFFLMQAAAITAEDFVTWACAQTAGPPRRGADGRPVLWARALGYAWVLVWLAWTTPGWMYPLIAVPKADGSFVLPVGVVRPALEGWRAMGNGTVPKSEL